MSIPDTGDPATGDGEFPETVAREVLAHPAVVELDGGPHGVIASYLPGRRVLGVRAGRAGEPVELSVVLRPGHPIPDVVAELRALVRSLAGDVPVDVTVSDLRAGGEPASTTVRIR